jgi:hypothetical protein
MGWHQCQIGPVTASASVTRLKFKSLGPQDTSYGGPTLDAVQVIAFH